MNTNNTFKPADNLVRKLIANSSGTLEQAILELIQNSRDSGATEVTINISEKVIEVIDNGRGINIDFSSFGADFHDNEDDLGKFGTGRTKIITHGYTAWVTRREDDSQWTYEADFEKWGIDFVDAPYEFEIENRGTRVVCTLNNMLSTVEYDQLLDIITRNCGAMGFIHNIIFKLNNNIIKLNTDYDVSRDTSDYLMLINSKGDNRVEIYNRGLFVKIMSSMSVSGIVISKKELQVTNERNDIHRDCPLFNKIQQEISEAVFNFLAKKRSLTEDQRMQLVRFVYDDASKMEKVMNKRIFKTANDKWVSFKQIREHEKIGFAYVGSRAADLIIEMGIGMVLEEDWQIEIIMARYYDDSDMITSSQAEEIVANKGLKLDSYQDKEVAKWAQRKELKNLMIARILMSEVFRLDERDVIIGRSNCARAWTDGMTYIALNYSELADKNPVGFASRIWSLIAHEMSHTSDTTKKDHVHGVDFNENFLNIVESKAGSFSRFMTKLSQGKYNEQFRDGYYTQFGLTNEKKDYKRKPKFKD